MTLPKKVGVLPVPISTFIFGNYFAISTRPAFGKRKRAPQTCSFCHKVGHRITKCPDRQTRPEPTTP